MHAVTFSILVVDDDADDRFIIDEAFKEIGYECEIKKFINGDALLHYLDQLEKPWYPSLIVLDNTLSNVSAGEILTKLKKNPNYGDIPVVIYSTSVSKLKTKELLDMGAYAAIEKGQVMSEVIEVAKRFKSIAEQK